MSEITISEIKAAVHEVIDEQRRNFWVEPERHWRDHELLRICEAGKDEWRLNHEFVGEIRRNVTDLKRSAFRSAMALIGIGSALALSYVVAKVKGWM